MGSYRVMFVAGSEDGLGVVGLVGQAALEMVNVDGHHMQ